MHADLLHMFEKALYFFLLVQLIYSPSGQRGGFCVPVTVGFTFSQTVLAVPSLPLYVRSMFETFTSSHGTPLLQINWIVFAVADVPLMSWMVTSLILIVEGI